MINPNTSEEFTRKIKKSVERYAFRDTGVVCVTAPSGPRAIGGIYDELLSTGGALKVFFLEKNNFDGFVIACFSDHPVVYAAREITSKPVVGIAEASMHMACFLGHKFSVITTNQEWIPLLTDAVRHYGLEARCASIRALELPGLALKDLADDDVCSLVASASRKAIENDGGEVICLGGAVMTGLDKQLEEILGIPVLDGVVSGLKWVEAMIAYGVHTSKIGRYPRPKLNL